MLRPWQGDAKPALDLSVEMVKMIEQIYQSSIVEIDDDAVIKPSEALQTDTYGSYIEMISALEKVDLNGLDRDELQCFFLNIYQCMFIHKLLKCDDQEEEPEDNGFLTSIKRWVSTARAKKFFYNIGGLTYTLEELKHGVLRGNRRAPGGVFRYFSRADPRNWFPDRQDNRILFLCLDSPDIPEEVVTFDSSETLNEKLGAFLGDTFARIIEIDTMNEEITMPKLIETYKSDFGSDEEVLRFVWNWFESYDYDIEQVVKVVKRRGLMIKYDNI